MRISDWSSDVCSSDLTNDRALRHFARTDLSGSVRLGVTEDVVLAGLPELLRRFTAEHPHVALELTIGLSEDLREKLELGVLDLAFVKRTTGDGQGELVWREPLVWIVRSEEHTSELQSLMRNSYDVFCLKKKIT